jgi:hypothetical protein
MQFALFVRGARAGRDNSCEWLETISSKFGKFVSYEFDTNGLIEWCQPRERRTFSVFRHDDIAIDAILVGIVSQDKRERDGYPARRLLG